jgi:hypothetical protein
MKIIIVTGLLITAALSLVTNLVSNFLSPKVKKNQKLLWVLFGVLILASIIIGVIPQEWYAAKMEILDIAVSAIYQEKQDESLNYVACEQQVKLINRGNANTTVIKYSTLLNFSQFSSSAESYTSHTVQFSPYDASNDLGHFEIGAYPFIGEANLWPLPSVVFPQSILDFVVRINFAFSPNAYEVFDVHSNNLPQSAIPLLVQYQFEMADGSKIESKEIPCAYLYAKTVLAPSP